MKARQRYYEPQVDCSNSVKKFVPIVHQIRYSPKASYRSNDDKHTD